MPLGIRDKAFANTRAAESPRACLSHAPREALLLLKASHRPRLYQYRFQIVA